jgi:hypothetical protein
MEPTRVGYYKQHPNGVAIAQDRWVTLSSLSGLEYTGSAMPGTDKLWVIANNGRSSNMAVVNITDSVSATIANGTTLELASASSAEITFGGSTGTLQLDDSREFSGKIIGFTGTGNLATSDQIDLRDINFNSVYDSYSNGVLTVSDGSNTANLTFNGSFTLANFSFASDGHGGTILYDPPVSISNPLRLTPNSEDEAASPPQGMSVGFDARPTFGLPGIALGDKTYLPNGNGSGCTLAITDGAKSGANVALLGNYIASSFAVPSDPSVGPIAPAEASQAGAQFLLTSPHQG